MTKKDKRAKRWLTFGSWMSYLVPLGIFAGFNFSRIFRNPEAGLTFFGITLIASLLGVVFHQLGLWKKQSVKLLTTSGVLWLLTALIPNILVFAFIIGGGMLFDETLFRPNIEKINKRGEKNEN